MKRFACVLLCALWLFGSALAQTAQPTAADLLGAWEAVHHEEGGLNALAFGADGMMRINDSGAAAPFVARGGILVALLGDQPTAVAVSMEDGDTLMFSGSAYRRTAAGAGEMRLTNALVGDWQSQDDASTSWTFGGDGKAQCRYDGQVTLDTVYMASAAMLVYAQSDTVYHSYRYRIHADGTLVMEEDDGRQLKFTRTGAPAAPDTSPMNALQGKWHCAYGQGAMDFTYRPDGTMEAFTEGYDPEVTIFCARDGYQASMLEGELIVSQYTMDGPDRMVMDRFAFERIGAAQGEINLRNELLGRWTARDDMGTVSFHADGTALFDAMEASYAAGDGQLIVLFDGGMANVSAYKLAQDGALTLTLAGETIALDRAE